jgi:site-specific recombinase
MEALIREDESAPSGIRNDGATSIGAASNRMFEQCRFELRRQHRKGTGAG